MGLLLPCVGSFAALRGLFSSGSRGWFTGYVNRLISLLCFLFVFVLVFQMVCLRIYVGSFLYKARSLAAEDVW